MLPSVTRVLGAWTDFSGIDPDVLENAARRGTAAHNVFAAYASGLFIPAVAGELAGYFKSFKTWFDRYVEHVFFIEKELIDPALGFCGHADAGIRLADGRCMVADWKTPATASKTWPIQTAAYLHLARRNGSGVDWDGCMVLQPKADGTTAKATDYSYEHKAFAVFLSALNCYRYFKKERRHET